MNTAVTEITVIYTALQALPNYNTTAANLGLMGDKIAEVTAATGLLNQLAGNLTAIGTAIDGYPSFVTAGTVVGDLDTTVSSLSITAIVNVITNLLDIIGVIPDLITEAHTEMLKLTNVSQTELDAVLDIVNQVYSFNATIMKPPNTVFDYADDASKELNFTAYNETLYDYLKQVLEQNDEFNDQLTDAYKYRDDATNMDAELANATSSYNISGIITSLNSADELMGAVNMTKTSLLLTNFASSLSEIAVPSSLLDELITFQIQLDRLNELLARVVDTTAGGLNGDASGDYIQLAKGYCSNALSTLCTIDGDCGGGTCTNIAIPRCSADPATQCSADSTCEALTPTSYCLFDTNIATVLAGYLSGFSSSSADIVIDTTLLTDLTDAGTNNNLDVPGAIASINSASDSVTAYNVTNAKAMIEALLDSLGTVDIVTFIDQINDVIEMVSDLNATDYVDQMDPYIEYQADFYKNFEDAIYFKNFFFDDANLGTMLNNMHIDQLEAVSAASGPNAAIYYANSQLDNMTYYFNQNKFFKKYFAQTHHAEDNKDSFDFLDKLGGYAQSGYGDMRVNGATYYFMRLFNSDQVLHDDTKLMGIVANSDGERYENDNFCYTNDCDDHTSEVLNTEPLSTWSAEFPGYAIFEAVESITMSREDVFLMLWIPPLIVAFLSLFVALFNWKYNKPWAKNCCTFTFSACVMIQLPFVLLFTAMLFPFTIVLNDVCNSGSGIGYSYMTSYGDELCTEVLSGDGTLSSCVYVADMGVSNATLELDILGLYQGLVAGECTHDSPATDPFAKIFYSIADQIDSRVEEKKNEELDMDEYRYAARDLIDDTVVDVVSIFSLFFNELGDHAMNCESIAAISRDFSGATCGSYMTPTLWFLGGWYLVSWILVCCAFPFGCLKRYVVNKEIEKDDDGNDVNDGNNEATEGDLDERRQLNESDVENNDHEQSISDAHKSDNEEVVDAQLAGIPVADDSKMKSFDTKKPKPSKAKIVVGRNGVISGNADGEVAMTEWKDGTKEEVFL